MKSFTMWQNKIIFKNGWYLFLGENGNNSVITGACARRMEAEYNRYQADMDVDRGGLSPELAYPGRGFKKSDIHMSMTALMWWILYLKAERKIMSKGNW